MFGINESYLLNQISKNQVVLFLGAGFSSLAKNKLGNELPLGQELSKRIWEFLHPDLPYQSTPLKLAFQALLTSNIGVEKIKTFLNDNLLVESFPDFYKAIKSIYWYRIYTTNIDNLIDQLYYNDPIVSLDIVKYPEIDLKERDQLLEKIQIIHLNGKLKCELYELIFATEQYGHNLNLNLPFYSQFVSEYTNKCTIFIGTSMEEDFLWQYIEERKFRKKEVQEFRLKSFLISPNISVLHERVLEKYNIIPIRASAEDFLKWISESSSQLPSREEILKKTIPSLVVISKTAKFQTYNKSLKEFAQSFDLIPENDPNPNQKSSFLLGTFPRWTDIFNNLDAKREITQVLHHKIKKLYAQHDLKLIALLGSAGCGKSTILKRLAFILKSESYNVYFTNSDYLLSPQDLVDSLNSFDKKTILIFDYSITIVSRLHVYIKELNHCKIPPIIIIASRQNDFDRLATKEKAIVELEEVLIPDLSKVEIKNVIETLENHHVEGVLKGKRLDEQISMFENVAKNQLLVAMREATKGERFDSIIQDEFATITPNEAQILCLCISLATDAGYKLSKDQYMLCTKETPSDALYYLSRNLKGIVLAEGIDDSILMIRHRIIAERYIYACADREMLKEAYLRLLKVLSIHVIKSNRRFYGFNLYKDLINHKKIYQRMGNNIDDARYIFEQMITYFNNDHQFWHQYGTLEILAGDFNLAENYLNQAKSLCPTDHFIDTSFGNLFLKRAISASSNTSALGYFQKGKDILTQQFLRVGNSDAYCYHIYCTQTFNYITTWIRTDEMKKEWLRNLLEISTQAVFLHPKHKQINKIHLTIERSLYNLSIPIQQRPQEPIIGSE